MQRVPQNPITTHYVEMLAKTCKLECVEDSSPVFLYLQVSPLIYGLLFLVLLPPPLLNKCALQAKESQRGIDRVEYTAKREGIYISFDLI